jgi:hypothetical protein
MIPMIQHIRSSHLQSSQVRDQTFLPILVEVHAVLTYPPSDVVVQLSGFLGRAMLRKVLCIHLESSRKLYSSLGFFLLILPVKVLDFWC